MGDSPRGCKELNTVHVCVRVHACTHTHTHTHTHKGTAHAAWTSWSSGMYLGYPWVSAMWAYGPAHSLTLSSVGWGLGSRSGTMLESLQLPPL